MLLLILAHWHDVGIVQQDVRRHQHRVIEQPGIYVVEVVALVLEAMCIRQHRVWRKTVQCT